MNYNFIKDSRAMLVEDYLVIADLHIGYSKILEKKGYNIPNQTKQFLSEIKALKKTTGAKNLIILGDIKHNIPKINLQEKYEIPDFFYELSDLFKKVILIKGNHDGMIESMIHPKNVEIKKEFILNEFGFIHGHSWPTKELMQTCQILIMGHVHPVFKIKDQWNRKHYYPCWMIGNPIKTRLEKFGKISVKRVIVVPVFNKFFSGHEKFAGPFQKALRKEEIFLLDLTKVK